jgi:hypothetical protein
MMVPSASCWSCQPPGPVQKVLSRWWQRLAEEHSHGQTDELKLRKTAPLRTGRCQNWPRGVRQFRRSPAARHPHVGKRVAGRGPTAVQPSPGVHADDCWAPRWAVVAAIPGHVNDLVDAVERYLDERDLERPHLAGLSLGVGWPSSWPGGAARQPCARWPGGFRSAGDSAQAQVKKQIHARRRARPHGRRPRPAGPHHPGRDGRGMSARPETCCEPDNSGPRSRRPVTFLVRASYGNA